MPSLKGRILSVVGEAKKLALVVLKMAVGAIHPTERARHKKRRRRTPAFRGQASQLVDFSRLSRWLVLAGGAEAELAGQKPSTAAAHSNEPRLIDGERLWRKRTKVALYASRRIDPVLGVLVRRSIEREFLIVQRFGHQISCLLGLVLVVKRRFINRPRQRLPDSILFGKHDRMMLLSAVAAEEGRVKARLFVIRIEKLAVEGDLCVGPALSAWNTDVRRRKRTDEV